MLTDPVDRFVGELTPVLSGIAQDIVPGVPQNKAPTDVTVEAYNLVAAFIDVDGRETDDELWAFITTFAPRMDTNLHRATPEHVRSAGLVKGKRAWLATPSLLFDVLVHADKATGTRHALTYYRLAMDLAHAVCATDAVPSEAELAAIERFRSVLLRAIDGAGLDRPGAPQATGTGDRAAAPEEQEPPRPLEEVMAELDALIGLAPVKSEVKLVADLIQVQKLRKDRGLPVAESSRHLVFTGNPGTGKTTVARLLAQIYRTLGVVERGHLVETDRSGLVAGYVGQTALKVREVFESALQGVLLIDEAYALARGGDRDFGQEATDTLVKLIEDHRDDVVVIAAGYPAEMATFVDSNPGLRSRFPKTIHFPDYSAEELLAIFELMCRKHAYTVTTEARDAARAWFEQQPRDKGFGNARLSRNLFEAAMARQASRIVELENPSDEQLMSLELRDVIPADGARV